MPFCVCVCVCARARVIDWLAPRKGEEETQTITCLLDIPTGESFSSSFYICGTQHAYLEVHRFTVFWFLWSYRQKWIIWDSFLILILWSWLAIAWKMNTDYWCMSSCLEAAWKIIYSGVSYSITYLHTIELKWFDYVM